MKVTSVAKDGARDESTVVRSDGGVGAMRHASSQPEHFTWQYCSSLALWLQGSQAFLPVDMLAFGQKESQRETVATLTPTVTCTRARGLPGFEVAEGPTSFQKTTRSLLASGMETPLFEELGRLLTDRR